MNLRRRYAPPPKPKPQGFNASYYQISLGYRYFMGRPMPGDLPFDTAAYHLIDAFGRLRVEAVLTGIPNDPKMSEANALILAGMVDPGPE